MTAPTIRAELAIAVSLLNLEFSKIPESAQPDVAGWGDWDHALEIALASDDHDAAVVAIHEWRDRHLRAFRLTACARPDPRTAVA